MSLLLSFKGLIVFRRCSLKDVSKSGSVAIGSSYYFPVFTLFPLLFVIGTVPQELVSLTILYSPSSSEFSLITQHTFLFLWRNIRSLQHSQYLASAIIVTYTTHDVSLLVYTVTYCPASQLNYWHEREAIVHKAYLLSLFPFHRSHLLWRSLSSQIFGV
jgi:hypothetical protein